MKPFRVEGRLRMGRNMTPFAIEVLGADEAAARDRVLSTLGSRHGANRNAITILRVEPLAPDQVTDLVVQHALELQAAKGA